MTAGGDRAGPGLAGAGPVQGVVLAVRFLTELALLAALAVAGAQASTELAGRIALAVAGPVLAAVIWGAAIGPRAKRRLADPLRFAVETVMFGAATIGLILVGHVLAAVIFAVLAIGTAAAVRLAATGS